MKKADKKWRLGRKVLLSLLVLLLLLISAAAVFIYHNLNFDKSSFRRVAEAGFTEKQNTLDDGTILNYSEGPNSGPALLLIHGQTVTWQDYADVLPELSRHFHVFAVDCHGHGKSSKDPAKYTAEAMGQDFAWFIRHVVRKPAIVSGHSSGGLLAAWLATNSPDYVRGIVLEDPPFFSTEPGREQKTFAWIDLFDPIHKFFAQTQEKDFVLYYLAHSYWRNFFGNAWDGIMKYATSYRRRHPNEKLRIFFLPPSINRIWDGISGPYDPRFGLTFYDNSWFKDFDQAQTLSRIKCPSVLIHTTVSYTKDGILLGAMSVEDADRAHSIIANNRLIEVKSGHDFHYEKPKEFAAILEDFAQSLSGV